MLSSFRSRQLNWGVDPCPHRAEQEESGIKLLQESGLPLTIKHGIAVFSQKGFPCARYILDTGCWSVDGKQQLHSGGATRFIAWLRAMIDVKNSRVVKTLEKPTLPRKQRKLAEKAIVGSPMFCYPPSTELMNQPQPKDCVPPQPKRERSDDLKSVIAVVHELGGRAMQKNGGFCLCVRGDAMPVVDFFPSTGRWYSQTHKQTFNGGGIKFIRWLREQVSVSNEEKSVF